MTASNSHSDLNKVHRVVKHGLSAYIKVFSLIAFEIGTLTLGGGHFEIKYFFPIIFMSIT